MDTESTRLNARLQIEGALYRNARGVDRRDWDLFRSAYHGDAHDDHGDYSGDIDGLVAHLEERHALIPQAMHQLHAIAIEFAGDAVAVVETQFTVLQSLDKRAARQREAIHGQPVPAEMILQLQMHGRYVDLFECRQASWRIARRTVVVEQIWSCVVQPAGPARWTSARRDGNDPIELLRREFGVE